MKIRWRPLIESNNSISQDGYIGSSLVYTIRTSKLDWSTELHDKFSNKITKLHSGNYQGDRLALWLEAGQRCAKLENNAGKWLLSRAKHGIDPEHKVICVVEAGTEDMALIVHSPDNRQDSFENAVNISKLPEYMKALDNARDLLEAIGLHFGDRELYGREAKTTARRITELLNARSRGSI